MTYYDKLVRDGIPTVLKAAGVPYETRTAEPRERYFLLLQKLKEEVAELVDAGFNEEILQESADILEVLDAIAKLLGDPNGARDRQLAKREERGGFEKWIVLISTGA